MRRGSRVGGLRGASALWKRVGAIETGPGSNPERHSCDGDQDGDIPRDFPDTPEARVLQTKPPPAGEERGERGREGGFYLGRAGGLHVPCHLSRHAAMGIAAWR